MQLAGPCPHDMNCSIKAYSLRIYMSSQFYIRTNKAGIRGRIITILISGPIEKCAQLVWAAMQLPTNNTEET
jgi:hypothetical protein